MGVQSVLPSQGRNFLGDRLDPFERSVVEKMKARIIREASDPGGILASDEIVRPRGGFGPVLGIIDFVELRHRFAPAGPAVHVPHVNDHQDAGWARDPAEDFRAISPAGSC